MNIKIANTLFDDGIFSELYKAGFITAKVFTYREIYLWYWRKCKPAALPKTRQCSKPAANSTGTSAPSGGR